MDTQNYKKALAEVKEIINHSEKEITDKIPNKFWNYIINNMDLMHSVNIDFYNENWEDTVLDETKAILAMLYRDYIANDDEREFLIKQEKEEEQRRERELREKYNPDNLFKNKEISEVNSEDNQLIVIEDLHWYQKIYQKILKIFGIKKY
ncbi:MAG: hypothetical protein IKT41_01595 [Clostridia bacterium]|nr:hypothetical protein [Clostridia bacterium]